MFKNIDYINNLSYWLLHQPFQKVFFDYQYSFVISNMTFEKLEVGKKRIKEMQNLRTIHEMFFVQ